MKRGEIWLVNFAPTIGDEIGKIRPAVIINDDKFGKLDLSIILPITDWKETYINYVWMIPIEPSTSNHLSKKSSINCFQIKSLSHQCFVRKLGTISLDLVDEIEYSLSTILKFN